MTETVNTNENIIARGKLFELVQTEQPDGRVFEKARRAPGVRLIVPNFEEQTLLLTREYRTELQAWDYRLPGGKVFDTLDEYAAFRQSGRGITEAAEQKAVAEGREEAGLDIRTLKLVSKSTLGATVEWDLYIFEATDWQKAVDGQQLEQGEQIEADNWLPYADVETIILEGHVQEDRVALKLLQWLRQQ